MANMSDNPDIEASKWFVLTMVACALYIGAAFTFVVLQDVEPTVDQVQVTNHD